MPLPIWSARPSPRRVCEMFSRRQLGPRCKSKRGRRPDAFCSKRANQQHENLYHTHSNNNNSIHTHKHTAHNIHTPFTTITSWTTTQEQPEHRIRIHEAAPPNSNSNNNMRRNRAWWATRYKIGRGGSSGIREGSIK